MSYGHASKQNPQLLANNSNTSSVVRQLVYLPGIGRTLRNKAQESVTFERLNTRRATIHAFLALGANVDYLIYEDEQQYLINLVDSPGHIDFSSEVSTAVRLCDGAVVMVDVVEGVCPQTHAVLRQAWMECIKPVLVLNKMDRLITELKMTPLEAHLHLVQLLEKVNAITGELFSADVLEKIDDVKFEPSDDSHLYFCPDQGNVVFASAIDGWGFGIESFAQLYAAKLDVNCATLQKTLWGDFYLEPKTKRIKKGAQVKGKKPLFVQFILDNLWAVYDAVLIQRDKERVERIVKSLHVKISARDSRHVDPRVHLQAIFTQWLPLADAVLATVVCKLPNAKSISEERVEKLLCSSSQNYESLPTESQKLKRDFIACRSDIEAPVIIYVSKMVPVDKKLLPIARPKLLSEESLFERHKAARQRHDERLSALNATKKDNSVTATVTDTMAGSMTDSVTDAVLDTATDAVIDTMTVTVTDNVTNTVADSVTVRMEKDVGNAQQDFEETAVKSAVQNKDASNGTPVDPSSLSAAVDEDEDSFIAFARIFSGTVRSGQVLYVLGPKHDPRTIRNQLSDDANCDVDIPHVTRFTVDDLYLFMGRELHQLDEVPAGNVLGLRGLQAHILKSATVSSTLACPAFTDIFSEAVPILRVAVEPKRAVEMPQLVHGMRLLNQADACVQVLIQETGEHVLIAAGEVHLQKCLDDLRNRFAKIALKVSSPIVPFRETIVPAPQTDRVNQAIVESNQTDANVDSQIHLQAGVDSTPCKVILSASPLPAAVVLLLVEQSALLQTLHDCNALYKNRTTQQQQAETSISAQTRTQLLDLKSKFTEAFATVTDNTAWKDAVDRILAFGPRRCGPNILMGASDLARRPSLWVCVEDTENSDDVIAGVNDSGVIGGFQLAMLSGPLCEEPLHGVCINLHHCDGGDAEIVLQQGSISGTGQLMTTVRDGIRRALCVQPMRLMVATYTCDIQATADVLGKLYAVLGRRNGQVLSEDLLEGTSAFNIHTLLPVVESFGFVDEIRKRTSGLASPQLRFTHWELIDIDPFWVPTTEEEYMHFGEKADSENIAHRYMNEVRKRKGLKLDEQIVESGTKQRTLTKNK